MAQSLTHWQNLGPQRYSARLEGGSFAFELEHEHCPLPSLCDVALRENARRRFHFVGKALGRHHPTRPAALRQVARALAERLQTRLAAGPVVFIGMAETATTLGQAVFREWQALGGQGLYIESTRRCLGGDIALSFVEAHSHATAHALYPPAGLGGREAWLATAGQVVIVDDEATTGRTAEALVAALRDWRAGQATAQQPALPFEPFLAVLLRLQPTEEARKTEPTKKLEVVSLVEGRFSFTAESEPAVIAEVCHRLDSAGQCGRPGARRGLLRPEALPGHWAEALTLPTRADGPPPRVLVIGAGEYGFQPLLLAEALEAAGAECHLLATTRSPIELGGAVQHRLRFPALSGEGYTEHLYNVPVLHDFDRVILCLEDGPLPLGHPLAAIPGLEVLHWQASRAQPQQQDWVATDLDRTLFARDWAGQTGALPATWRAQPGQPPQPSSWMPAATHRLMLALQTAAKLVPVTARDAAAFSHVAIDGLHLAGPAVLANGALVLDWQGRPDAEWDERLRALLAPWQSRFQTLCARLIDRVGSQARPRLVEGPSGCAAYLVVKASEAWWQSPKGQALASDAELWQGLHVSLLGPELQALPSGLGKAEATAYVAQKYFAQRPPLLALGDMPADLAFLHQANFMALPPDSLLAAALPTGTAWLPRRGYGA